MKKSKIEMEKDKQQAIEVLQRLTSVLSDIVFNYTENDTLNNSLSDIGKATGIGFEKLEDEISKVINDLSKQE